MTADWMASGAVGREDDLDAAKSVVRVAPGVLETHMRRREASAQGKPFERVQEVSDRLRQGTGARHRRRADRQRQDRGAPGSGR